MGSLFKCLDPGPPDESVRQFWHIHGLLVDAAQPSCSSNEQQQHRQAAEHSPSVDTLRVGDGQQQQQAKKKKLKKESVNSANANANNNKKTRKNKQQLNGEQQQQLEPKHTVQRLPPGVLFVYEGRLVYRARHWSLCCPLPFAGRADEEDQYERGGDGTDGADEDEENNEIGRKKKGSRKGRGDKTASPPDELAVELCHIGAVNVTQQFISQRDNKPVRCNCSPLVDVLVTGRQPPLHIGILIAQADAVGKELRECFLKHRHRPRIFQFNSVDVEGVEIDVP